MLSLDNVSVAYRGVRAVDSVSFTAKPGRVLGLIGPNGSGKSSLLKAIAGLLPFAGAIWFGDQLVSEAQQASAIGYMPQDTGTRGTLTSLEVVLLGRLQSLALRLTNDDLACAQRTLDAVGALHLADRTIGELSGGQRQLVFLAQALAASPQILLLDEPTSALDLRHQLQVLGLMRTITRRQHLTTVVVLHDLSAAARHVDDVVVLSEGRMAASGVPQEVFDPATIASVFGVAVSITRIDDGQLFITPTHALSQDAAHADARSVT